jgi:hypothetical protein
VGSLLIPLEPFESIEEARESDRRAAATLVPSPFESIEEARVSDRPGLGLGRIFPGSELPLLLLWLETDEEREFVPAKFLVSDRPDLGEKVLFR